MNKKMDETARYIKESREGLNAARKNVANITGLQKELFANLTRDTTSMLQFFVDDKTNPEDKPR